MAKENITRFFEEAAKNKTMQERIKGAAENNEELIGFAAKEGFDFTARELDEYLKNEAGVPVADEKLDNVTGWGNYDGQYNDQGYLLTTIGYGCPHWDAAADTWAAAKGQCGSCCYWQCSGPIRFAGIVGVTFMCTHPANRSPFMD